MAAKKAATKQPAKAKAGITGEQLAAFMGVDTAKAKGLKVYCDAAQNVCNSFAGTELMESHLATMALLHCAAWLQMTKAKTIKELKEIPLKVRYMIISATEEAKA
jgi:hypothetical protein